jgi:hypothetical protein
MGRLRVFHLVAAYLAYISGRLNKNTNPERARDRSKVIAADADETTRRALTGRDIIDALAGSSLADVPFERLSVKSKVLDGPKF